MSRKKQELQPYKGPTVEGEDSTTATFVRDPLEGRRHRLLRYQPDLSDQRSETLKPLVVRLIESVPYTSDDSDDSLMTWLYDFTDYCCVTEGSFDPDRHLTEDRFSAFLNNRKGHLTKSSRATGRSVLRRISRARKVVAATPPQTIERTPVQPPFTKQQRAKQYKAATSIKDSCQGDLMNLLDLTYGAGLAPNEACRAKGTWLRKSRDGQVSIIVPNEDGEYREVPLFGEAAVRLGKQQGAGYLLRPNNHKTRHNVISAIVSAAKQHKDDFADWRAPRARGRWIADLMTMAVPFVVVCQLAGISAKSRTFPDILNCLEPDELPSTSQSLQLVLAARLQRGLGA